MKKKLLLKVYVFIIGGLVVSLAHLYMMLKKTHESHGKLEVKLANSEILFADLNRRNVSLQNQNDSLVSGMANLVAINVSLSTKVDFLDKLQIQNQQEIENLEEIRDSLHIIYQKKIFEAENFVYYPMKRKLDSLCNLTNDLLAVVQFLKSQRQQLLTELDENNAIAGSVKCNILGKDSNEHSITNSSASIHKLKKGVVVLFGTIILAFIASAIIVKRKYGKRRPSK